MVRKVETYHGPSSSDTHGVDGPVQISRGPFHVATSENDFIKAIGEVGWQEIPDLQTLDANNGVQRAMRFVSPDGKRQDAAHVYLHPRLQDGKHPNLHVVVESQVIRVLFDGKRAVGIEYQANSAFQSDTSRKIVKARKLIVISAGAFGSPLLLERSGVGAPEILERAGLPLIQELHGVGASYQDHQLLAYPYRSALSPEETFDALASGRVDAGQLIATNSDIIGWNAQDITCKLRPSDADVAGLGSNFQHVWNRDFKDNANKPLIMIALVSG